MSTRRLAFICIGNTLPEWQSFCDGSFVSHSWRNVGDDSSSVLTISTTLGGDWSAWDASCDAFDLTMVYLLSFRSPSSLFWSSHCYFLVLLVARIMHRRLGMASIIPVTGRYHWVTWLWPGPKSRKTLYFCCNDDWCYRVGLKQLFLGDLNYARAFHRRSLNFSHL